MKLEDVLRDSRIFTVAERKSLQNRVQGERSDRTGIFAGRVKPKVGEILEWSKPEHKRKLKKALVSKRKRRTR